MRKARALILILALAPMLQGCLVVGATALAADVAVGTVGAAVDVTGAAIDVVTPDGKGDDDDR